MAQQCARKKKVAIPTISPVAHSESGHGAEMLTLNFGGTFHPR
jgi:hypothetical protein